MFDSRKPAPAKARDAESGEARPDRIMKISPLDMRQQRFKKSFRGFDRTEVVAFLTESADDYEQALRELKDAIVQERSLTMTTPRFLGLIRVCPATPKPGEDAVQTEEIERIGMVVAMQYEAQQGRIPEDVSFENLGFDIRSREPDGRVRYIEVKARAETGPVSITQNEWFKAKRFQDDYFLYTVMNAAASPELYIIQNPAQNLNPDEKIEVVRYIVPFAELTGKGIKAVD